LKEKIHRIHGISRVKHSTSMALRQEIFSSF